MATAAMVVGIIGVVLGTILGWLVVTLPVAFVLGVLGIIFGIIGRRRFDQNPGIGRRGQATAGLILGIIAVIASILWGVGIGIAVDETEEGLDDLNEQLEELETQP